MHYLTFLFILIALPASATRPSINPERSVYSFIDIFNKKTEVLESGVARVYMTSYDESGDLQPRRKIESLIAASDYNRLKSQASAVLRSVPTKATYFEGERWIFEGTAFHIGDSLVLTNNHVLSRDFSNTTRCDGFRLKDEGGKSFYCKTVHYCHPKEDLCLIEMKSSKRLSKVPTLKLSNSSQIDNKDVLITAIGNTQGHGIHVSVGKGLKARENGYDIYPALRNGNSGGPAIGPDGSVIGIVRTETHVKVGPSATNNAVKMTKVIELIRNALQEDPETLEKFNRAVIE
jgi:S1-C subfamily serine protease